MGLGSVLTDGVSYAGTSSEVMAVSRRQLGALSDGYPMSPLWYVNCGAERVSCQTALGAERRVTARCCKLRGC